MSAGDQVSPAEQLGAVLTQCFRCGAAILRGCGVQCSLCVGIACSPACYRFHLDQAHPDAHKQPAPK